MSESNRAAPMIEWEDVDGDGERFQSKPPFEGSYIWWNYGTWLRGPCRSVCGSNPYRQCRSLKDGRALMEKDHQARWALSGYLSCPDIREFAASTGYDLSQLTDIEIVKAGRSREAIHEVLERIAPRKTV